MEASRLAEPHHFGPRTPILLTIQEGAMPVPEHQALAEHRFSPTNR